MESQNQPNNYQFFKTLAIGFTIVSFVIAIGIGGYILGTRNSQSLNDRVNEQNPAIFPSPRANGNKPLPSTVPDTDETANWKTYTLTKVDIQFKLPPQITKEGNYVENILTGDKGTNICFQLTEETSFKIIPQVFAGGIGACGDSRSSFLIGGTSVDYEAGRGGIFTDHQGYKIENGKFYARFVNNYSDVREYSPLLIKNPHEVNIVKLKGFVDPEGMPKILGENRIGALINTSNAIYPGIAIEMKLSNELNEQLFDRILSTFRFSR